VQLVSDRSEPSPRILVTGSSRGIGRAIALRLAATGWRVALHFAHDEAAAAETLAALGTAASGSYRADLSDPEQAPRLWATVSADGPVAALVNNAGIYVPHGFLDGDEAAFLENYRAIMAVNLESPLRLMRVAAADFSAAGAGRIVNVASRVGFKGEPNAATYAASKSALINFTRSLAVELAPKNVQLFGIAPGWVETAMARDGMGERLAEILATLPLGRMASPEDCANAAEFFLRPESSYLSGVTLDINGASYFH